MADLLPAYETRGFASSFSLSALSAITVRRADGSEVPLASLLVSPSAAPPSCPPRTLLLLGRNLL
jgi:hypothetical protein